MKVVGPTFAIGVVVAGLFAAKIPEHAVEIGMSIMAGPLAGLWGTPLWSVADVIGWTIGCLIAISAHPLRSGWFTGVVSVIGLITWTFLGLALTFDGV